MIAKNVAHTRFFINFALATKKLHSMKHLILLLFLAITSMTAMAQTNNTVKIPQTQTLKDGSVVYLTPDSMAEYPGGIQALMQFLSENIKYPVEAQEQNISGRVICSFIVNTDGTVSDAEIVQRVHPTLDKEALRVVNMQKGWIPARHEGKSVRMKFTLPITFSLPTKKVKTSKTSPTNQSFDTFAKFPGGTEALLKYLNKNIKYPRGAEIYGISGRGGCTFIVEKDGSISDVKVAKSVHPSLDKEAVRVISTMPKWTPAMENGKPVRAKYSLPVTFTLQSKKRNY